MKELRLVIQSESRIGISDALKRMSKEVVSAGFGSVPILKITSAYKVKSVIIEDAEIKEPTVDWDSLAKFTSEELNAR